MKVFLTQRFADVIQEQIVLKDPETHGIVYGNEYWTTTIYGLKKDIDWHFDKDAAERAHAEHIADRIACAEREIVRLKALSRCCP